MSAHTDTITEISLKSCPEYLPRIRKIAACLADGVGMSSQEIEETTLALTEACTNAIRHGSPRGADDSIVVKLMTSSSTLIADVTDCGNSPADLDTIPGKGMGMRLMRMLTNSMQIIRNGAGMTVRLTKRAGQRPRSRRVIVRRPTAVGRN